MKPRAPRDLQAPFDRVTYRAGQLLTASDLQDDLRTNQRLRRLHTHYLHNTWGVALGFAVIGNEGQDSVYVGPGYAVDAVGREILFSDGSDLPIPQTAAQTILALVVTYRSDSQYQNLPDFATLCAGSTADPRLEQPVFAWRTADTLQPGMDVPLASITIEQGALVRLPDLSVRRTATRQLRPYIGFGSQDYTVQRSGDPFEPFLIDTSDAGFVATPSYFAKVELALGETAAPVALLYLALAQQASFIATPSPVSFTYFVFYASQLREAVKNITITWFGIEPIAGCEPTANPYYKYQVAQSFATAKVRTL